MYPNDFYFSDTCIVLDSVPSKSIQIITNQTLEMTCPLVQMYTMLYVLIYI